MAKKKYYLVLDTETATLPFINDIVTNAEEKKTLAIAKPLVYDIGWIVCDRQGNHIEKKQYLIAETFCVPSIFNTAYYAEKRPIYLSMLERGETTIKPWREVMDILIADMQKVDAIGAFNSMFDFKKAIPFTELYINKLYSPDYYNWETMQKAICENILHNPRADEKSTNFDKDNFKFHDIDYPLFDIWGLATKYLLNRQKYKDNCIKYNMLTNSGTFFKTSAESTYRYLCNEYGFIESHTALDDARIETFILSKIAMRRHIDEGIDYFPFRSLGYTDEYVLSKKKRSTEQMSAVYNAMAAYIDNKLENSGNITNYMIQINKRLERLENALKTHIEETA